MISYKTLVIITVMFSIVICNELEECKKRKDREELDDCQECKKRKEREELEERKEREERKKRKKCEDTLLNFGFDSEIGLYNFSFVNQFEDYDKFKNNTSLSAEVNGYLKAIYDVIQKEKKSIEEKYLSTPEMFCKNLFSGIKDEFIEILKTSKDKRIIELFNKIESININDCTTSILKYVYREAGNRLIKYDASNPYNNFVISCDTAKKENIKLSDPENPEIEDIFKTIDGLLKIQNITEVPQSQNITVDEILKTLKEVSGLKEYSVEEILKKIEEITRFKKLSDEEILEKFKEITRFKRLSVDEILKTLKDIPQFQNFTDNDIIDLLKVDEILKTLKEIPLFKNLSIEEIFKKIDEIFQFQNITIDEILKTLKGIPRIKTLLNSDIVIPGIKNLSNEDIIDIVNEIPQFKKLSNKLKILKEIPQFKKLSIEDILKTIDVDEILKTLKEIPRFKKHSNKDIIDFLKEITQNQNITDEDLLNKLRGIPELRYITEYVFTYFSSHMYIAKTTISAYEKFKPSALCENYLKKTIH